jgi:RNA-binding protein
MPNEPEPQPATLSATRRKELRAAAHDLKPVVQVGHGGVHEPVIAAVSRALRDHELIKVRMLEPEDKHAMAEQLASETDSALCGLVGHTVILYKPRPKAKKPKPKRRASAAAAKTPRAKSPAPRSTPRRSTGPARAPKRGKSRTSR